ncbi:hypothetical protein NMG60_11003500 [Bertholletia excelsa]
MKPENWPENVDFYQFLAGNGFMDVGGYGIPANCDFPATQGFCSSSFYPWETSGITETPESRALAASNNHKEAEKRRRERINSHLDKLRTLLLCNSKTDKASLLGKVIERVKELKQQTSELMQLHHTFPLPSETDEISVHHSDSDGKLVIKATLCCEDRSDLIPQLIETLRSLELNPLRAEMATLGGRTRNVLVVAGKKNDDRSELVVEFLREALKSLVHPASSSIKMGERSKRRRLFGGSQTHAIA